MEALSPSQVDELLDTATVMHLACVDAGPSVTALSYVVMDGDVYFRTYGGRRIDALRNPRVALEVCEVDPESGDWLPVIGEGAARIVEDPATAALVEGTLIKKYATAYETLVSGPSGPPLGEAYIVHVTLGRVTGRSSGSAWGRKTRPGRM